MPDEIVELLNSYNANTLFDMAQAAGMETMEGGSRILKVQLVKKMRAEYFTPARIQTAYEKLQKRERDLLNRLLFHEGPIATHTFRRHVLRAGLATAAPEEEAGQRRRSYQSNVPYAWNEYAGQPNRPRSRVFQDIIAQLTYHGLVFSRDPPSRYGQTDYKLQFHPGNTLFIPEIVRRHLPEPEPLIPPNWEPERAEGGAPVLLLRDLYIYWDFVRRHQVKMIQVGFVGKRSLKEINRLLIVTDPQLDNAKHEDEAPRLYLLRQLLVNLGLLQVRGDVLQPTRPDPLDVPDFWSQSPVHQQAACLAAWTGLEEPVEPVTGESPRYPASYRRARAALIEAIQAQPEDRWIETEELAEHILSQDPEFLFPGRNQLDKHRYGYYHSDYYYGNRQQLIETMNRLEMAFINRCLTGFLRQVGAVKVGYEKGQVSGYRLTPAGRVMLGLAAEDSLPALFPEERGEVFVQPNFQLMAIGPVSPAVLARLDLFADRQKADRGACEYQFSQESVYRAQQLGMDVTTIVQFLEQHSQTEIPQNVRRSFEEWAALHQRIVFRTGVSLVQAVDADLLAELANDPTTGDHLARPVAPEVALIEKDRHGELIAALMNRGLFPTVTGANPEAADDSVVIDEDGSVEPVHAVPSLHLRGRLTRLAEQTSEGWRLTPNSIRRAGGSRKKVLWALEEISRLHRGTLPQKLVERIKAWGGYYGQAQAQTLTLIEFRDQQALEELREHAPLSELLSPFPAGDRALAVVPREQLEQVKDILDQLGVPVQDGQLKGAS